MSNINLEKMNSYIGRADIREISKIWSISTDLIYMWGMYSLEDVFDIIDEYIPEIYEFIDIIKIKENCLKYKREKIKEQNKSRKTELGEFLPMGFESEAEEMITELYQIRDKFGEVFSQFPTSIEKTEAWLYPHALEASTDSGLEALIYFKSIGENLVDIDNIKESWRKALCTKVERGYFINEKDKELESRVKNRELRIEELSEIFAAHYYPEFFSYRDEEEAFILPTFFRAVEWLEIDGFEDWVNYFAQEISETYHNGIDNNYSLFQLFYLSRSDLVLKKASKFGIEAYLYGVCIGSIEKAKPWKRYWYDVDKSGEKTYDKVEYFPSASIIAFAWKRIQPENINEDILKGALELLLSNQLDSGAWPLISTKRQDDLFSTYYAMLAIGLNKPSGYRKSLQKAKRWLLSQQNEVGCWYIQGGPVLMINILCLEAIKLAEGNEQLTYDVNRKISNVSEKISSDSKGDKRYIVFCEGDKEGKKNKDFDEICYKNIFRNEFPHAIFCSVGSCNEIENEERELFKYQDKINPNSTIIKLVDRDDKSDIEIEELLKKNITVLSLREIENYLLSDEIIRKLCNMVEKEEKINILIQAKNEAIEKSIERGNPINDVKSASGDFYNVAKKELGLTGMGSNSVYFLRDTIAPLVTQDTETYKLLRRDIFGLNE